MRPQRGDLTVRQGQAGTFHLHSEISGEHLGPPLESRAKAFDLAEAIYALPEAEQLAVHMGRVPAPGCSWLIGGGRESRS